jgi:hypothetical protein
MTMVRDMKPILECDPAREPNREALALAIAAHAGAARDLQVAEQAAKLALSRYLEAQSALDELHKAVAAPSGALATDFIASISAGNPCGTAVLERSAIDARAQIAAVETDIRVWEETQQQCELAVRAKEADVVAAKERVERCARAIICNSEKVKRLGDGLEALQAEVIEKRSELRFIWGKWINGELPGPLKERVERLLWRDLMGLESTSASAAWSAAFDELLTNSEAELPT